MSWWGKIFGSAFGFALGGPLGALLGVALGHRFDKGYDRLMAEGGSTQADVERIQSAFFAATFSVMGHLAKADGRVSEAEIQLAQNVMSQMQLDADQRRAAINLFNQGKDSGFDLDAVLHQFKQECHGRRNLIQMFIEILIATVLADGTAHKAERDTLHYVGKQLGFAPFIIDQLIQMAQAQQEFAYERARGRTTSAASKSTLKAAYQILGVAENASNDEVKKAYRRLMNQHHPDKLVSKGLPEEMMKLATEKTQEIKQAYERIQHSRGM